MEITIDRKQIITNLRCIEIDHCLVLEINGERLFKLLCSVDR